MKVVVYSHDADTRARIRLAIGRPDDGWLATWSRADAVISNPLDPVELARQLAGLMRQRAAGSEAAGTEVVQA